MASSYIQHILKSKTHIKTSLQNVSILSCRYFANATCPAASPISILRRKTGLSFSLCREALNKNNNDVVESENWLRAYTLTHSHQKAAKLASRKANEGLISLSISQDYRVANLLELNCETDFVSKNKIFKDFLLGISANFSVPSPEQSNSRQLVPGINELHMKQDEVDSINNDVSILVTKLGEKIKLGRALSIYTTNSKIKLFGQMHPQIESTSSDGFITSLGRFGSIVCIEDTLNHRFGNGQIPPELINAGNRICNHVIGYSPDYIELPDEIRKQMLEMKEETKKLDAEQDVTDLSHQNAEVNIDDDTIVYNPKDEWPSLMDQTLIMSDSKDVRTFCKENNLKVSYFKRFECGESVD